MKWDYTWLIELAFIILVFFTIGYIVGISF